VHDVYDVYGKALRDLAPFGVDSFDGLSLLDLGCGQRYPFSLLAAADGAKVTALDVSWIEPSLTVPGLVRSFRRNGSRRAVKSLVRAVAFDPRYYRMLCTLSGAHREDARRVNFVCADPTGRTYPLESAKYDVAVSIAVLEHVRDITAVASEVARVLKPGGLLFAMVHNFYSLSGGHRMEWAYPDRDPCDFIEPWDHLRRRQHPADCYLNRLRPDAYRDALARSLDVLVFDGCGENHDPGVAEGESFLWGRTARELQEYPAELLLTRSWRVIARKVAP
jgi:SAM-dependent methyltransferase